MATKTDAAQLYERREQLKKLGYTLIEQDEQKEVWAPSSGFPRIELRRAIAQRG